MITIKKMIKVLFEMYCCVGVGMYEDDRVNSALHIVVNNQN